MPITGTYPAATCSDQTGEEYVATWLDPGWDLWRRLPGESDFTEISHIADGPEQSAGLTCEPAMQGRLIFSYFDGSATARLQSTDQGDTWEAYS